VRERRKAGRTKQRQSSERDRRKDRKRGGQPGHPGAGLPRDPDPDERAGVLPPAECSRCGPGLAGAERAGTWWSQVWDGKIARSVTEYLLPLLGKEPVLAAGETPVNLLDPHAGLAEQDAGAPHVLVSSHAPVVRQTGRNP
jgi:hypothetical protein